jgi:AcrR family transcriptional regulator
VTGVTDSNPVASRADGRPADVPGAGGPRSEGTRRAILGAARAAFAAQGFEQTTIRAVAAGAGVDASMVMRYFGSKAGLFTAAATLDVEIPDLRSAPAEQRGELLARQFIARWEDSATDEQLIGVLRTAVTSDAVAARFQTAISMLITEPIAALGGDHAAERGGYIAAQLLGLALCRYILRIEPLASLRADEVVAAVAPSIQRWLTGAKPPRPTRPGPAPAAGEADPPGDRQPSATRAVQDQTVSREHVMSVLERAGLPEHEAREAIAVLEFPAPLSVVSEHLLKAGITHSGLIDRLGGSP